MVTDLERAEEELEDKYSDQLADYVMQCFEEARNHRETKSISNAISESLRRYRGVYSCEDKTRYADIQTYMNVTFELCNIASNWLKNSYFSAQDRPWTLEPTPNPELPENLQEEMRSLLQVQLSESLKDSNLTMKVARRNLIQELSNTASHLAMRYAVERSDSMTRLIEDQLEEANWNKSLFEFLQHLVIYPNAFLKGPNLISKRVPVATKDSMEFKEREVLDVQVVDPENIYPSPDSTTIQDGRYLIEKMKVSRPQLLMAKKLKGFDKNAIDYVIASSQRQELPEELDDNSESGSRDKKVDYKKDEYLLDVFEFHGTISGVDIIKWTDPKYPVETLLKDFSSSVEVDAWGEISPHMDYEAVVWVCGGVTVMARIARADPIPYRPYYTTSMYKIPGSFWGRSIPMTVAPIQDDINNAARARTLNSAMSSGPLTQIDKSRLPDNDYPEVIMPNDVIITQSNTIQGNNAAPAVRFDRFPNESQNLTAYIDANWDRAYRITGITPQMAGLNQSTHRTLGAFSLQYSSATKGIQAVVANIDQDVIEEVIRQIYHWNMMYHEDQSVKGDIRVRVRGASGLIAQEQKQSRPLELLQALGPILAQMQPETNLALANAVLKESGFDPAELGAASGLAEQELQNKFGLLQGQPQTDGRSGNVPTIVEEQLPSAPPTQ